MHKSSLAAVDNLRAVTLCPRVLPSLSENWLPQNFRLRGFATRLISSLLPFGYDCIFSLLHRQCYYALKFGVRLTLIGVACNVCRLTRLTKRILFMKDVPPRRYEVKLLVRKHLFIVLHSFIVFVSWG